MEMAMMGAQYNGTMLDISNTLSRNRDWGCQIVHQLVDKDEAAASGEQ